MMTSFAWVTLLNESAADVFVADLVRRHYAVKALCDRMTLTRGADFPSAVLALQITHETHTPSEVHDAIIDSLGATKLLYHSLVVVPMPLAPSVCKWSPGNIHVPMPVRKKSHLAAVKPIRPGIDQGKLDSGMPDGIIDDEKPRPKKEDGA